MSRRFLIGWFAALSLAAVGSRLLVRGGDEARCSLDGAPLDPIHRVDLLVASVPQASFCSLACALAWPEVAPAGYWQVRDEVNGEALDAARACFVESTRAADAARRSRVHVFASAIDAAAFCAQFGGVLVASPFVHAAPNPTER